MDPKVRAIVRKMKQDLAQMRQPGHLELQLARLRLTTADLAIRKGRRA